MDTLRISDLYPATIEVNGRYYFAGLMSPNGVPLFSYRDAGVIEALTGGARAVSRYSLFFPGHHAFYEVRGVELEEVSEEVYGSDNTPVPVFGEVWNELAGLHDLLAEAHTSRASDYRA